MITICYRCKIPKESDQFHCDKSKSRGHGTECKSCAAIRKAQWQATNREHYNALARKNDRKRRSENPELYRVKGRIKDRLRQPKKTIYTREKRRADPNFYIASKLRTSLWNLLHGKDWGSSSQYLGCSIPSFRIYIESLFETGMHWGNYGRGGWSLDHIMPCALFDLTDLEQRRRCFHFSNLRPMWMQQNQIKSNRVIELT